jgi:hypothetical protein
LSSTGSNRPSNKGDASHEPHQPSRPRLDSLITEIPVDCYNEDEALTAFENAFDEETSFPIPATIVGENIEVLSIGTINGRSELIATCQRAGKRHRIALLDIRIPAGQPASHLVAAYRRWLGL